jgi:hypothetical protein
MPYKKLCLPDRIQTMVTMTAEELSDLLKRMPISVTPEELTDWEACRVRNRQAFNACLPVLTLLLGLVLPGVAIEPAEITWAYTVAQTRAVTSDGGSGKMVPLFDMLNHAVSPVCILAHSPHSLPPDFLAQLALDADPAHVRLTPPAPGEPAILTRRGRRLARLDACDILIAPPDGAPAGAELRLQYHDTSVRDRQADIQFAVSYGFYPAA